MGPTLSEVATKVSMEAATDKRKNNFERLLQTVMSLYDYDR